ncbi:hypothetical protein [Kitasatospora sp. NPDC098663]|uniref:hypothetical protein n=1 Tax=Kitasatospora sp. NPDC098663 TaxID=3364096 RepID=UPI0037F19565
MLLPAGALAHPRLLVIGSLTTLPIGSLTTLLIGSLTTLLIGSLTTAILPPARIRSRVD